MPPRKTILAAGEYYHVFNRGVERRLLFFERENYAHFLRTARRYLLGQSDPDASSVRIADELRPVSIVAYCLMPNHFHFIIHLRCEDFSARMSSFQKSYTQAINRARQRVGPLFQGRFRAEHVDREEYLTHLSRYIHLNPVAAGLVRKPADWEYSSYREYAGLRDGSLPEPNPVLQIFESRAAYRRFVEHGTSTVPSGIRHLLIDD
jgi:putative transposase